MSTCAPGQGDPRQLPATVHLNVTSEAGQLYQRSLFARLEACGYPVEVLRVQYRMHPAIRTFPSAHFYKV